MTIAPNDFTHLHVHSEFSLLDGLGRITELVDTAAQLGMDSMAITDHGALYGAVAFHQAARSKGIKPIIGVETYVARRSMVDKEGKADAQPFHLILLAENLTGQALLLEPVSEETVASAILETVARGRRAPWRDPRHSWPRAAAELARLLAEVARP